MFVQRFPDIGVADVLGVLGFLLALLLAIRGAAQQKPHLHVAIGHFTVWDGQKEHLKGVRVSVYNLGRQAIPLERIMANPATGGGATMPGSINPSVVWPGAVGQYENNPETPCVVQPGHVLTWLADAKWVRENLDPAKTLTVELSWFQEPRWWHLRESTANSNRKITRVDLAAVTTLSIDDKADPTVS